MRKTKPPCKTPNCKNTSGGGLDYCYLCLGIIFDNAIPWQPAQIDDSDLPSRDAYRPRSAQLAREARG